ncbi:MAG TPA: hypothetical protein PLL30_03320 [Candidatus Krumholzibacteria bacterium]|nr:hypothetical protein [Candidatus Krumholzibacteria bacterium]HPD70803.1 hypothetical protein [Candidatus Krumholzibacteria bacterium]HRY39497.1 hypothetical protein [Candidatus Krumholzibacteria bacterium]
MPVGRLPWLLCLLGLLAGDGPVPARAAPPPVRFRVEDEAGLAVARLCERAWTTRGAAAAAAILPPGAAPDTVHCLVLGTERFTQYFADRLPDWGVGVALPPGRLIAIDWERVPSIGPGTEAVFLHEMAHALLFQAAGEARLPTWLHEGAAMRASGEWRFTDTVGVLLSGNLPSLASLEGPFPRGAAAAERAYRTSLLAVNWLEKEHGPDAVRRVAAESRRFADFDAGFSAATGEDAGRFAGRFADAMRLRYGWILLLFRWPTLFVVMALAFAVGAARKIARSRRSLQEEPPEDADGGPFDAG